MNITEQIIEFAKLFPALGTLLEAMRTEYTDRALQAADFLSRANSRIGQLDMRITQLNENLVSVRDAFSERTTALSTRISGTGNLVDRAIGEFRIELDAKHNDLKSMIRSDISKSRAWDLTKDVKALTERVDNELNNIEGSLKELRTWHVTLNARHESVRRELSGLGVSHIELGETVTKLVAQHARTEHVANSAEAIATELRELVSVDETHYTRDGVVGFSESAHERGVSIHKALKLHTEIEAVIARMQDTSLKYSVDPQYDTGYAHAINAFTNQLKDAMK